MRGSGSTASLLGLACVVVLMGGCKEAPVPPKKTPKQDDAPPAEPEPISVGPGVHIELGNVDPRRCRRTLCIGGPGEIGDPGNRDFAELCRRSPGIVQRCDAKGCATLWSTEQWEQGLAGLLGSLDQNHDGKVDDDDPACPIGLAGWSTGGVIVADALPKQLAARAHGRHAKVGNMLSIAPYRAGLEQLDVATNVARAFNYRNSVSPPDDCSRAFEGGPWLSPPLRCSEGTVCYDYDYSLDLGLLAFRSRQGARAGSEIGHCSITSVVAKIGLDNISRGQEALRDMVPPYIDGKQGGRERPRGPAVPDPVVVLPNEPER